MKPNKTTVEKVLENKEINKLDKKDSFFVSLLSPELEVIVIPAINSIVDGIRIMKSGTTVKFRNFIYSTNDVKIIKALVNSHAYGQHNTYMSINDPKLNGFLRKRYNDNKKRKIS